MKTQIFKDNPKLKEVHMTSDGEAFYNDNDAKMHAKTLEDKKVELVLNPDFLDVVIEEHEELETEHESNLEVVKTGEAHNEEMVAVSAEADGSVNELQVEPTKAPIPSKAKIVKPKNKK